MQRQLTSFGTDNRFPCLICKKGWLHFTTRAPSKVVVDGQDLTFICNECCHTDVRVVDSAGNHIG
jgi:hypothetical protein